MCDSTNLQELLSRAFLLRQRFTQQENIFRNKIDSKICQSWVLPVWLQQETLTQLEFYHTQRNHENTYLYTLAIWHRCLVSRPTKPNCFTRLQSCCFLDLVLPFSLHIKRFNPSHQWLVVCQSRRHLRTPKERCYWKPPYRDPPWPWMLVYNSALTSSSGHPVGLITMIPELCPLLLSEIWKLHHSSIEPLYSNLWKMSSVS